MIVDLHLHTSRGSSDSSLSIDELVDSALAAGLTGVAITEHDFLWRDDRFDAEALERGIRIFRGIEVSTDYGHVIDFGLREYVSGIHRVVQLRAEADRCGGALVSAHPFRRALEAGPNQRNFLGLRFPTIDEAAAHPLFRLVDALEIENSATAEEENEFAAEVARALGLAGTGGSDSHSRSSVGRCRTRFDPGVETVADLAEAIRVGECLAIGPQPAVKR